MTLLEAMTALVILGASAAGFLGLFQASARSAQAAREWHRATAAAGAVLEESVRARIDGSLDPAATQPDVRVSVASWNGNVDEIVVQAVLPGGRSVTVHRLVRNR